MAKESVSSSPRHISVQAGASFVVSLERASGTGYSWAFCGSKNNLAALFDIARKPQRLGPGAPVVDEFIFVARQSGESSLDFQLLRPWLPAEAVESASVSVRIVEANALDGNAFVDYDPESARASVKSRCSGIAAMEKYGYFGCVDDSYRDSYPMQDYGFPLNAAGSCRPAIPYGYVASAPGTAALKYGYPGCANDHEVPRFYYGYPGCQSPADAALKYGYLNCAPPYDSPALKYGYPGCVEASGAPLVFYGYAGCVPPILKYGYFGCPA